MKGQKREERLERSLRAAGGLLSLARNLRERLAWEEELGLDFAEERRDLRKLGRGAGEVLRLLGRPAPEDPLEAFQALGTLGREMERKRRTVRAEEVDEELLAALAERLEALHSQATDLWLRMGAKRDQACPPSLEELKALLG